MTVLRVLLACCAALGAAHRPAVEGLGSCGLDFSSSDVALNVPNVEISWTFSHYFDCSARAVWMTFQSPRDGFADMYVGAGTPMIERFAGLRPDILVMGPGLPPLTDAELARIPEQVRADPAFVATGYLRAAPEDQTTCEHLSEVMRGETEVKGGQCVFYEPWGQSDSYWLLDADNLLVPEGGATYYAVVWLREDTSGKLGIAMGDWPEDFRTQYELGKPTCSRDMSDFHEKRTQSVRAETEFPAVACEAFVEPEAPEAPEEHSHDHGSHEEEHSHDHDDGHSHSHDGHSHEGHSHSSHSDHEGHAHEDEGHSHSDHDGHAHDEDAETANYESDAATSLHATVLPLLLLAALL
mmetsp:Transcript_25211/g.75685  ORF Transcript_25211/g.75685 Transcript_25211/m.75685 type:complete len:353 (+) Transcript_25211:195-1253(+)|eukprot:CAMPEP_0119259974 /NCGR_PEP_ID=MMETSP1329-20130426/575_1 /TAXON_ID=114041 /ORGANISM="Genus nov. species nov., Strain RCC1024" /LENGTH=352 /DNA_ID=CAMNT_0007259387 /DNA_START=249 /DNA_END=1307 /DNA_ORIENTATION=-